MACEQEREGSSSKTVDREEEDTDTRLALLASLLHPVAFSTEQHLKALASAGGDVGQAAAELLLPKEVSNTKRKAPGDLRGWLDQAEKKRQKEKSTVKPAIGGSSIVKSTTPSPQKASSVVPINAFTLLGKPSSLPPQKRRTFPQGPVYLSSQSSIDAHSLPLTIFSSFLLPSMASALYLTMMKESEDWDVNRFYIAGKPAQSPHTTSFYMRKGGGYGGGKYFYAGMEQGSAKVYPPILEKAADLVEQMVNKELKTRPRYALEWAGEWKANVCGVNRYDGAKSSVGWHADQLTYLGPYALIASLSLGTPRSFRLRETQTLDPGFAISDKPPRTYELTLGHNTLCLMNAGCQERYKHTVPAQKSIDIFRSGYDTDESPIPKCEQIASSSRINITFRFYREDFHPNPSAMSMGLRQGTPLCKCGLPTVLRADQKAKARSRLAPAPMSSTHRLTTDTNVMNDDMLFFWQCQSPTQSGEENGCGFFRILNMKEEGRGPCVIDKK